jgi:hypothetical protein
MVKGKHQHVNENDKENDKWSEHEQNWWNNMTKTMLKIDEHIRKLQKQILIYIWDICYPT